MGFWVGAGPLFYEEAATKNITQALNIIGEKVTRSLPPTRELIIFGCYFMIAGIWLTVFGAHITLHGDDWQMVASSHLGFYPACTGLQTWIVPYRPLHPILHCLAYQVYGLDTTRYYALSALCYAGVAHMWHRVSRRMFGLPTWASVLAGIIWLSFPDDLTRQSLIGGFRLLGPLLTLVGIEIVISSKTLRPVGLGCLIALGSFLIYENLIGLWIGLPVILAFMSKRERKFRVRLVILVVATATVFTLWRTIFVQTTYTGSTFVEGQHSFYNNWNYHLLQLQATPWLPTTNTIRSMVVTADQLPFLSSTELSQMRIAATLCGLLALAALLCPANGVPHLPSRRALIVIGLLALPLGAAPYYLTELDFVSEIFRSLNIPFGVSLVAVGFLFMLPRKIWRVVGIITSVCLVIYATSTEAVLARGYKSESKSLCVVLEQIASALPSFDGGMILVEDWQNTDAYMLSSVASVIWGSPGRTNWSLGVNGSHGYHLSGVEKVEIKGDEIRWEGLPPAILFKKAGRIQDLNLPLVVFRMEGERASLVYSSFDYKPDGVARERVKEMCGGR